METEHHGPPNERDSVLVDTLKGAVAGGIAVWVMDQVDWYMYDHEDPEARRRTQEVRPGGLDPSHHTANKIAGAFGKELSPRQPHPAGIALHYAIGIGAGSSALYGALQDRVPAISTGRGALFGLGMFLLHDEFLNTALGSAARPSQYPWQAHARGLISHVVYGVVTDTILRILKGPGRLTRYSPEEAEHRRTERPASDASYGGSRDSDGEHRRGTLPTSGEFEGTRSGHSSY
jgi:hypothetical protein